VALKQQASGWPPGCGTDEEKQAYLDEFEALEGILLNPELIMTNPGLRMIAVYSCFFFHINSSI
jgi:hypothetical protein